MNCQRAAGGNLVQIGLGQDQAVEVPHLFMQQPHSIVIGVVGAEGVGADQLGQTVAAMGLGPAMRAHFVQHHFASCLGGLPRRFAARQSAPYDMNHTHCTQHFSKGSQRCGNIV